MLKKDLISERRSLGQNEPPRQFLSLDKGKGDLSPKGLPSTASD